jgi:hypothetical protein
MRVGTKLEISLGFLEDVSVCATSRQHTNTKGYKVPDKLKSKQFERSRRLSTFFLLNESF